MPRVQQHCMYYFFCDFCECERINELYYYKLQFTKTRPNTGMAGAMKFVSQQINEIKGMLKVMSNKQLEQKWKMDLIVERMGLGKEVDETMAHKFKELITEEKGRREKIGGIRVVTQSIQNELHKLSTKLVDRSFYENLGTVDLNNVLISHLQDCVLNGIVTAAVGGSSDTEHEADLYNGMVCCERFREWNRFFKDIRELIIRKVETSQVNYLELDSTDSDIAQALAQAMQKVCFFLVNFLCYFY